MAIWVTSDWHFNHANILRYCRPQFSNIDEHNNYIIDRYNSTVGKDDLVYVLGDIGFSPASKLAPLVQSLNGRKIMLVGNHDRLKDGEYRGMGFIDVVRHPIYYSSNIILSHIPIQECLDNPWVINLHGHLHNSELILSNFINVNLELHDFLPLDMKQFEERAKKECLPTRYQPFPNEWYSQWEKRNILENNVDK
ncbi:MAG: metallophosphoesterase [Methanobrevibacter sp.]|nr:metallophosphoesterase [Methanobrevibacter sp.]